MVFSFQEKISDLAALNEKRQCGICKYVVVLAGKYELYCPSCAETGFLVANGSVLLELNRLEFEKAAIRPSTLMPMSAVNWNCMSVYAAVTMAGQLLAVCCPAVLLQN